MKIYIFLETMEASSGHGEIALHDSGFLSLPEVSILIGYTRVVGSVVVGLVSVGSVVGDDVVLVDRVSGVGRVDSGSVVNERTG